MPLEIYCLFSIQNLWDQPEHNLVAFWSTMPTATQLASIIGDNGLGIAQLRINGFTDLGQTEYRLKRITEGIDVTEQK